MQDGKDTEILKAMAETVAEYGTCILEVIMWEGGAMAHLIPIEEETDEEDD